MRNIFELNKNDLWWLEDKFNRYNQLDKEIAIRKEELRIKRPDDNIGGGKVNTPSSPVENQVIKEMSDQYIANRTKWKKGIDEVYEECTEEEKKILNLKFFNNTNYYSWTNVANECYMSRSKIYEVRYSILQEFAKKIGYI